MHHINTTNRISKKDLIMKIIFISPQVNPFMTTGGLGDYVDGLTNSLSSNSNINIKVIIIKKKSVKKNPIYR